ncbi:hypothetical protein [Solimonas soli]|uniref:hypothetical protein n=1 Tax=Solimonas soli TaxID=413479 RepID=UPI0004846975|nr:hypothetical protein [Solimonas soli]
MLTSRARLLLTALALLGAAPLARADEANPPPDGAAWCAQHPDRCEQAKARLKAKCDADPAKCEEVKAKLQEKAAECQAKPEQCKQERRARLEAACANNPQRPICKRLDAAPAGQ